MVVLEHAVAGEHLGSVGRASKKTNLYIPQASDFSHQLSGAAEARKFKITFNYSTRIITDMYHRPGS